MIGGAPRRGFLIERMNGTDADGQTSVAQVLEQFSDTDHEAQERFNAYMDSHPDRRHIRIRLDPEYVQDRAAQHA